MKKFDTEFIIKEIADKITSVFNAKLALIDAEKNDGITLKQLDTSASYFQTLNNSTINYNPFLLYGLSSSEIIGKQGNNIKKLKIYFLIVYSDADNNNTTTSIMYRYQRALEESIQDNCFALESVNKMVISSIDLVDFKNINTNKIDKAIGITIDTDIMN